MELCNFEHDEICFDGKRCPLCELLLEVSRLQDQRDELEKEINSLQSNLIDKELDIEELERKLMK